MESRNIATWYSNYFASSPPTLHLTFGSKCQIQLLQNMDMLHIKLIEIMEYSNMVANILPADPPPPPLT